MKISASMAAFLRFHQSLGAVGYPDGVGVTDNTVRAVRNRGLLSYEEVQRGFFALTDKGRAALAAFDAEATH